MSERHITCKHKREERRTRGLRYEIFVTTNGCKRNRSEINGEDTEHGSSERSLEGVSNVSTKLFSDMDSCQLGKQRLSVGRNKSDQISGIVQLSDGQVAVVYQLKEIDKYLEILDKELETK